MKLLKRFLAAVALYVLVFGGGSAFLAFLGWDTPGYFVAFLVAFKMLHVLAVGVVLFVAFMFTLTEFVPKLLDYVIDGDWRV